MLERESPSLTLFFLMPPRIFFTFNQFCARNTGEMEHISHCKDTYENG